MDELYGWHLKNKAFIIDQFCNRLSFEECYSIVMAKTTPCWQYLFSIAILKNLYQCPLHEIGNVDFSYLKEQFNNYPRTMRNQLVRMVLETIYSGLIFEPSKSESIDQFTKTLEKLTYGIKCKVRIESGKNRFIVDRFAVSNRQYADFLNDSQFWAKNGNKAEENLIKADDNYLKFYYDPENRPDYPVVYVSWYAAADYCNWLSGQEGLPVAYDRKYQLCNNHGYHLFTDKEWLNITGYDEKAFDNISFPFREDGPFPIDSVELDHTCHGIVGLWTNIREWQSHSSSDGKRVVMGYPYSIYPDFDGSISGVMEYPSEYCANNIGFRTIAQL